MLDELLRYQNHMQPVMARAEKIFRSDLTPDLEELARCRRQVSRTLTTYQLFKHRAMCPMIIQGPYPDLAATCRALQKDCIALGDDFRAHTLQWNNADVTAAWDIYKPRALDLIGRTQRQLAADARLAQTFFARKYGAGSVRQAGGVARRV